MKKLVSILIGFMMIAGCEDLERLPQSNLSKSEFYQNADQATQAVNGIYNVFHDFDMYNGHFLQIEGVSSNALSAFIFNAYLPISENRGYDPTNAVVFSFWSKSYEGIIRANEAIANIPDIEMNNTLKNQLLGEARFLRALFYFHLTNHYRDVPLILEPQVVGEEALVTKSPEADVVAAIHSDLDFAIANLPTKAEYANSEVGRATKGAAHALKSRVHLHHQEWAGVIQQANEVENLGYGLLPMEQWPTQFLPEGNNNATESIFEVQFQANTGFGTASNYQNADIPRVTGSNGLYPTFDLLDAYEDGDPRKDWTILEPGDEFAGEIYDPSLQDQNFGITGLVRVKGVIEEKNIQGGQNFIVLRFAEMLINKAEALNEQGNTLDAYAPINRIRNRVGLSDLPAGLTQAEMREAIRHERRVELAFEGQYYFDVLRWGADALEEDMNSVTEINNHDRIFEPKLLVWPIPARELDVNPNLTQHPEWQ